MSYFLGMRSNADWVTDARPKSWRETILFLYPEGDAPLTGMMSKIGGEAVDDPQFYWWTQTLETGGGALTNIYTDAAMTVAYVSGGVAGNSLYVKVAAAVATSIRAGHQVVLRYSSDGTVDCVAKVDAVIINGANSMISVSLLEADDNSSTYDLSDANRILVIGNINPEGGEMPVALAKDPSKFYNYCQIFRTPLSITRTARKTKLRTGDQYQKLKREALEMHSIEMEMATFFGIRTEGTGANGKPERTTTGIVPFVRTNASSNVSDFRLDADYTGQSWLTGGEAWLDTFFEIFARYGNFSKKVLFCGSGALKGINDLAKASGQIQLSPETESYGLKVNKWITPFGTLNLMTHPLFSFESTTRYMIVGVEPQELKYRYIDDTTFYGEGEKQNTGRGRIDGTDEEFLTEMGYEFAHPEKMCVLDGVGQDNAL